MGTPEQVNRPGAISVQNKHILDTTTDAYRAAMDLVDQGYTVLKIRIGGHKPVIVIQNTPRCRFLRGAWFRRGKDEKGFYQEMASTIFSGCQVQWTQRGN